MKSLKRIDIEVEEIDIINESTEDIIVELLKKHKFLIAPQISPHLSMTPQATKYVLARMKRLGQIQEVKRLVKQKNDIQYRRMNVWTLRE